MEKLSYCGVKCNNCKVFNATAANDETMKQDVAKEWGDLFKLNFKTEQILCKGCKSDTVFMLCSMCDIKTCNKDKKIDACDECPDYKCDRLNKFHEYHNSLTEGTGKTIADVMGDIF